MKIVYEGLEDSIKVAANCVYNTDKDGDYICYDKDH